MSIIEHFKTHLNVDVRDVVFNDDDTITIVTPNETIDAMPNADDTISVFVNETPIVIPAFEP